MTITTTHITTATRKTWLL